MNHRPRPRIVLSWPVGIALLLLWCSVALAQAAGPIDPTHPLVAEHTAAQLIAHYGLPWGLMFVAFGLGSWFITKNDEEHWLNAGAAGRALHLIAGGVGVLGAVLDAQFNGGSWSAVYAYLPGVLALLFEKPAANSAASNGGKAVAVTAASALVVSLILSVNGCGATTKQIVADAGTCLKQAVGALPSSLEQDVQTWLTSTSLSDAEILQKLEALAAGAAETGLAGGEQAVVCIVKAVVDNLDAKLASQTGAGSGISTPTARGSALGHRFLAAHGGK